MDLKDKILTLKKKGITIKFLALQTNIKESTLYAFTSGKRKLSPEKYEKLNNFISNYFKEEEFNNNEQN